MYGKQRDPQDRDIKGLKVRVQATATEDTMFPAYGAQTVHMPFGSVYTSLQTGVVDVAENGINVYLVNKHYEVAPVLSMTEHEANNSLVWISDKLWQSLTPEQKGWVTGRGRRSQPQGAGQGVRARDQSRHQAEDARRQDRRPTSTRSGFTAIADPYLDKLAKELGPHAEKIKNLIRAIN